MSSPKSDGTSLSERVTSRLLLNEAALEGGISSFAIRNLSERIWGRGSNGTEALQPLQRLREAGALEARKGGRLVPGPGFAAALEEVTPKGSATSPDDFLGIDDLSRHAGQPIRRLVRDEALMRRIGLVLLEALEEERVAGRLQELDISPKRIRIADDWNGYVRTGAMGKNLMHYLGRASANVIQDAFGFDEIQAEEIPSKMRAINLALKGGLAFGPDGLGMGAGLTAHDRDTGRELIVCMNGWELSFFAADAENDYAPVKVDVARKALPVLRLDIEDEGGPLMILSGRGADDRITEALHEAHIAGDNDSWFELGSNEGRISHAMATYARTGILDISLGDVFPSPMRHAPTGTLALSVFGEVVSKRVAAELEAEGDEDWKAGYYIAERPDLHHTDIRFDHLHICREDRLVSLLMAHRDIGEEAARDIVEQAVADPHGRVYRDDTAGSKMLWLTYDPNQDAFREEVRRTGHLGDEGYGRPVALLASRDPGFPEGVVRVIEMPEITAEPLAGRDAGAPAP